MANRGGHPLDSDRGTTVVEEAVVTSIVSALVREAEGIRPSIGAALIPGDSSPTVGEFLGDLTSTGDFSRGVSVAVTGREATVALILTIPYGESIPRATQTVRDAVVRQTKNQTGLDVKEVNIVVADVTYPNE